MTWNYGEFDSLNLLAQCAQELLRGKRVCGQDIQHHQKLKFEQSSSSSSGPIRNKPLVISLQIPSGEYTHESMQRHCFLYDIFEVVDSPSSSPASTTTCACNLCHTQTGEVTDDSLVPIAITPEVPSTPVSTSTSINSVPVYLVPSNIDSTACHIKGFNWTEIRSNYPAIIAAAKQAEEKEVSFSAIGAGLLRPQQTLVTRGRRGGALADVRCSQWVTPDHAEYRTLCADRSYQNGSTQLLPGVLVVTTAPCPSCCRMLEKECKLRNIKAIVFGDSSAVQLDGLCRVGATGVHLYHDPLLGKDLIVNSSLQKQVILQKLHPGLFIIPYLSLLPFNIVIS